MKKIPNRMGRVLLFMLFYLVVSLLLMEYVLAAERVPPLQAVVTGTVTDSEGIPLPGVNVLLKDAQRGTVTDLDGTFSIKATPDQILVFSMVGFTTQSLPIPASNVMNVQMEEDVTQLGEVVLNAGYYTVKEKERTGSIEKVSSKVIGKQPVANPLAALQGRMAGVDIIQNSGVPGGGFRVEIRGKNSIAAGNEPLYVVDGVPYQSESLGTLANNVIPFSNISPLNAIDSESIESIEVLKDADATAIYGSRGANGVVLITTKKGSHGKLRTSVTMSSTLGKVTKLPELLNTEQYLEMRREAFANDGIVIYPPNAHDVNGNWDQHRYTDWPKVLIGNTSFRHNSGLTFTGGSERSGFMISGNHINETTVFPGDSHYKKSAIHSNYNYKSLDKRFQLNFSTDYVIENNVLPVTDFTRLAWSLAPNAPSLYDAEGYLNWENSTWTNPLASLESEYGFKSNNLITNGLISYEILPKLTVKANLGLNNIRISEFRTLPSTIYDPVFGADSRFSSIRTNNGSRKSWIVEPQVNWKSTMGKINLDFLIGASFQERSENILTILASNFPSNDLLFDLSAAFNSIILEDDQLRYKYHAVFGRLNLTLNNNVFVNLTGRRDGSSRFGPGRQFANFGAAGMAWDFSEMVKKILPLLTFGKLRGSYGVTGNDQIGDYQYLDTYMTSGISYNGSGLRPSRLFNPIFGWEENRKWEFGLDFGLWEDRIFLSGSWYRNRSDNQLVGVPQPATTGFRSLTANLGALVQNTGTEFLFRTQFKRGGTWNWTANLNLSIPRNTLLKFPDLESSTYADTYIVGEPLGILRLFNAQGVDPETGVYTFEDYNQDGVLSSPDDRQWIEDLSPKYFGGFSNTLTIGNWELDFLFQFKKQKTYGYALTSGFPGSLNNQLNVVADRWRGPDNPGSVQRYTAGFNGAAVRAFSEFRLSDANIVDGSFIRLRQLSIGYTIPRSMINFMDCHIYIQAQNLWTISSLQGIDPEQLSGFLPPLRQYTLGLKLNF